MAAFNAVWKSEFAMPAVSMTMYWFGMMSPPILLMSTAVANVAQSEKALKNFANRMMMNLDSFLGVNGDQNEKQAGRHSP